MNIVFERSHHSLPQVIGSQSITVDGNAADYMLKSNRVSDSTFIIDYNTPSTTSFHSDDDSDESSIDMSCDVSDTCKRKSHINPLSDLALVQEQDDLTATTTATMTELVLETTSPRKTKKKRVRLGSLHIHEHGIELGGAGVPRNGPSMCLGWNAISHITIDSIEDYEDARPCVPRKGIEMMQPKAQRVDKLLQSGYSMTQIRLCSQECDEIRTQRARTVSRLSMRSHTVSALKKLLVWKARHQLLHE